ncbi:MAG: saccharopine dehydrogenase NADP-binding domain-containing protein [Hyphomonadaceae bacterium]|nr:saccharopine dehydrogenase NADP-binding domain-containing protein [Hyphomonadaceae bacterium]
MSTREFDIIVYGASGFTGRLVAEYLAKRGIERWAMAGRDASKLESVRREIGAPESTPIVIANARDAASIEAMARRAKVVISTVGPYQLYGEPLVAACAKTGADYVDLCGEPNWMAAMIAKYEAQARESRARIVFSCGFDSIPFDCGVFYLQRQAQAQFGAPAQRVRGRVRRMKGTFSGGTLASMLATLEAGKRDPGVVKLMRNPFALSPERGAQQPRDDGPIEDADLNAWAAPFVMAAINTKNVHRSNALMGYPYGRDFTYQEMQSAGAGDAGAKRARSMTNQGRTQMALLAFAPTRALLRAFALPKPGQGPSREARERGSYEVLFVGDLADGRQIKVSVAGDRDPGYGSTSKMISEAALCLAAECENTPGGVWTPAAAMGEALIARLQAHAGVTFQPA